MSDDAAINTYVPEAPIASFADDLLDRRRFVERLASALIDPVTKKATGIVVGICGPWGSGKSSILNLLHEHIRKKYRDSVVVRFDPWLVSGRENLIADFFAELHGAITEDAEKTAKTRAAATKLVEFGEMVAPAADWVHPSVGVAIRIGTNAAKKTLARSKTLSQKRDELKNALSDAGIPIVVLVDELDRVEDAEIRTVAQVVRSVGNLPNVSYVIAYDVDRVAAALGSHFVKESISERIQEGRHYLEKIVQHQVHLPAILVEERHRLLHDELRKLERDHPHLGMLRNDPRFNFLMELLSESVITTLRDIHRLTGTFRVLVAMVTDEVDPSDLLAIAALSTKAPEVFARIYATPDNFVQNPLTVDGIQELVRHERESVDQKISRFFSGLTVSPPIRTLLGFLFPTLKDREAPEDRRLNATRPTDAICNRRPLLTALRLGLLPGHISRQEIVDQLRRQSHEIADWLDAKRGTDQIAQIVERLPDIVSADHALFDLSRVTEGFARFLTKNDCNWLTTHMPEQRLADSLWDALKVALRIADPLRRSLADACLRLVANGDTTLAPHMVRHSMIANGQFGLQSRPTYRRLLNNEETENAALALGEAYQSRHLHGPFVSCLWDLQPIYLMLNTSHWTEECRTKLTRELEADAAIDGFTILLFGPGFGTETKTIQKIVDHAYFLELVKKRYAALAEAPASDSLRSALRDAIEGF